MIHPQRVRKAYLAAQVSQSEDPKKLILLLFEEALRRIINTKEGIEENNPKKKGENLSRVIDIVSTLQANLDSSNQTEEINFLRGLYQSIMLELQKVTVLNDLKTLQLTFNYLSELKTIWQETVLKEKSSKKIA